MACQTIASEQRDASSTDTVKTTSLLDKMLMQQDLKMKSNFEFENLMQLLTDIKMDNTADVGRKAEASNHRSSYETAPRTHRESSSARNAGESALPIMPLTVAELRCMKRIKGIGQLKDENYKLQRLLFVQREQRLL